MIIVRFLWAPIRRIGKEPFGGYANARAVFMYRRQMEVFVFAIVVSHMRIPELGFRWKGQTQSRGVLVQVIPRHIFKRKEMGITTIREFRESIDGKSVERRIDFRQTVLRNI